MHGNISILLHLLSDASLTSVWTTLEKDSYAAKKSMYYGVGCNTLHISLKSICLKVWINSAISLLILIN